jgi:cation transport ATPase
LFNYNTDRTIEQSFNCNEDKPKGYDNMKKTYGIEVDCANCAAKMEDMANKTTGVANATVSFMTQKMKVEFEDGADEKTVMKQVLKNCRKVEDDCDIFF